jgi:hypothetical protein
MMTAMLEFPVRWKDVCLEGGRRKAMEIRIRFGLAMMLAGACVLFGCRRGSGGASGAAEASQGTRGQEAESLQTILTPATVAGGRLAQLRFEYISVAADVAAKAGIEPGDEVGVMTRCSDWRELSEAQCKALGSPPEERGEARRVWGSNSYILSMRDGRFWHIFCDPADVVLFEKLVPIMGDSYDIVEDVRTGWNGFTWTGLGDVLAEGSGERDAGK